MRNTTWYDTSPRHLVGGGDPRHVTQALKAAGWRNRCEPEAPHVLLVSPDARHTLTLEPRPNSRDAWWRLRGEHAGGTPWQASFGGNAPVEFLAASTDALRAPGPAAAVPRDIWRVLATSDWGIHPAGDGRTIARHPDGRLTLTHHQGAEDSPLARMATASVPAAGGVDDPLWRAYFSGHTPHQVLRAVACALVSETPGARAQDEIPLPHAVAQQRSSIQGEERVVAHEARLKSIRATARRARRSGRPSGSVPASSGARKSWRR